MKKTIFAFLFAIMFSMSIVSCGNGTATSIDSAAVDTAMVDTLDVDTVAVDTVAVDTTVVAE